MSVFLKRVAPLALVGTVAFIAGQATAADPMLADAQDQIHKAIYNVEAADDEDSTNPWQEFVFERRRQRTVRKLCVADYVIFQMRGEPYSQPDGSPCWDALGLDPPD